MKWSIYEKEKNRYVIIPKSNFIYFFWAIYRNLIGLFAPFPHNLTRYFITIEDAKKEI